MTEEFFEEMNAANNKALENYEYEINVIVAENQKQADLYWKLILSLIETFDYRIGFFKVGLIDAELIKKLGRPKISVQINEETNKAIIKLEYRKKQYCSKLYHKYDFGFINQILEEKDAKIYDTHENGFSIEFDASLIIDNRNRLWKERKKI